MLAIWSKYIQYLVCVCVCACVCVCVCVCVCGCCISFLMIFHSIVYELSVDIIAAVVVVDDVDIFLLDT